MYKSTPVVALLSRIMYNFTPNSEDLDDLTYCITEYINFCVDSVVPSVTVRCFPNNKPWVTRDIKVLLNEKKRAFRVGDREQLRRVQRELKERIQQGKDSYRRKLEHKLQQNNLKGHVERNISQCSYMRAIGSG